MGEPAIAASDRYALAVVAFELLTGEKPFQAEHFAAQARAHVEDDPPRVSEKAPELSQRVDDVIDRGMAKDPDDRWPTAAEFVERLEEAVTQPPKRQRTGAVAGAGTAPTRKLATRDRTPPPPSRPPRAAPAADRPERSGPARGAMVIVLVALLVLGALAFALLGGGDNNDGNNSAGSKDATKPRTTATPKANKKATATPTAQQTETPAPSATETPAASANEPAGNDPRALQLKAFNLNNQGQANQALPYAQKAVRLSCKGSAPVNPCGYALYELARAQRLTGDPKAAIKTLEQRQQRYPDDQKAAVDAEMQKAKAAAG
jgi:serine/threonine-protein kinase